MFIAGIRGSDPCQNIKRNRDRIRVFHRTASDAAADIRIMGFYDTTGGAGNHHQHIGVRVSNAPLDSDDDGNGDTLLTLKIPTALFQQYESTEPGEPHREVVIPAEELNRVGQPRIVSQEAEARWRAVRKS